MTSNIDLCDSEAEDFNPIDLRFRIFPRIRCLGLLFSQISSSPNRYCQIVIGGVVEIEVKKIGGKISRNLWNRDSLGALKGRVCSLCEVISHAGAEEGHLDFFVPDTLFRLGPLAIC